MLAINPRSRRLPLATPAPVALVFCLLASASLPAADSEGKSPINWQLGPGVAALKSTAEIQLPQGYKFANASDTQRLLRAAREPVSGHEMGMVTPEAGEWTV